MPRAFPNRREQSTLEVNVTDAAQEFSYPDTDVFKLQIEDFAKAVRRGSTPLPEPEEGLRNACVIETLFESANRGATPIPILPV